MTRQKQSAPGVRGAVFVLAGLVVLVGLAAGLLFQRQRDAQRQARVAESRRLVAQSSLARTRDPDVARLLGVEAVKRDANSEARSNLFTLLARAEPLVSLRGPRSAVESIAFGPDGKLLASGSCGETDIERNCTEGEIHLWDVSTALDASGALLPGSGVPTALATSVSSALKTGTSAAPPGLALLGHSVAVESVAFSPDGKLLASGSSDMTIGLWDVARRRAVGQPLTGHLDTVWSVAFSPDGKTLASGSDDETIRLWDVSTVQGTGAANVQAIGHPLMGHTDYVLSVAFSPDSKRLASGSYDQTIRLWDVSALRDRGNANAHSIGQPLVGHRAAVWSVAFSPDGRLLASGSADRTVRLWELSTGKEIGQPLTGHTDIVWSVAFSPDGKTLASGSADKTIRLWDVAAALQPDGVQAPEIGSPLTGHTSSVSSVAFRPDGKVLASGSWDETIRLWDVDLNLDRLETRACRMVNRNLTRAEYAQYVNSDSAAYDAVYARDPTCPGLPVEK